MVIRGYVFLFKDSRSKIITVNASGCNYSKEP